MLTGGLLILAGCGGGSRVVTKTVTRAGSAAVSTPAARPQPATTSSAAAGAFVASAVAADAQRAVFPVGAAVFAPAGAAALGAMATARTRSTAHAAPHTRQVAGHATGEFAVADTTGTFHHPSQIVLKIAATPAQPGSVYWNVVCFEDNGGVGREADHKTYSLPTTKTLALPAPSNECIASANVQLKKTGSVTISLSG